MKIMQNGILAFTGISINSRSITSLKNTNISQEKARQVQYERKLMSLGGKVKKKPIAPANKRQVLRLVISVTYCR